MKLKFLPVVVIGFAVGGVIGALVPPPPEGVDLLFKIGWYFGGVVGSVENLFR